MQLPPGVRASTCDVHDPAAKVSATHLVADNLSPTSLRQIVADKLSRRDVYAGLYWALYYSTSRDLEHSISDTKHNSFKLPTNTCDGSRVVSCFKFGLVDLRSGSNPSSPDQ